MTLEPVTVTTRPDHNVAPRRFSVTVLACAAFAMFISLSALAQDVKVVRIATGPIDTTEFPFGGLIGNAISNPPGSRECDRGGNCGVPGLIANSQTTDGAYHNLLAIVRGDIDLALSQADVANWAFYSIGDFENKEPLTRVRIVARLYPSTIHLLARKGAKITSVKDLAGKRVSVDGEGTATRFTVKAVLAAFGVTSTSVRMQTLDVTAATTALKDGKIDAMFLVSGAPVLALEDLSRTAPFELIPISGPTAEKLTHAFPFYSLGTIPANTYGEHPEIQTVAVGTVLVARDDLDDELGFGIANAIWHERNKALFEAGHARGKLMDPKLAAHGLGVPMQTGAGRYYISKGLMIPPPAIAPAEPSKPLPARSAPRAATPAPATQTPAPVIPSPAPIPAPPTEPAETPTTGSSTP